MDYKFTEDDKKKLVEFLNFVAKNASFTVNTQQIIEYFKLLNFMQQNLLAKVDKNILEVIAVHEAKGSESQDIGE